MQIKAILLTIVLLFSSSILLVEARLHKLSCPVTKSCPIHKHKVCGSDGRLYDSHCHIRKTSCERGSPLRAVHPDHCESFDDNEDHQSGSPKPLEDCQPKQYDSMKQGLLLKAGNDASRLFTQLDENNDGNININELWRKSSSFRPPDNSPCILTDLLQHEDKNQDDYLDFNEFQNAFANLYTITMVSLDQSLAVNTIQAHLGDNVEIRCDIVGNPQQPVIRWHRHNVDLSTVSSPNIKVYTDGSLYLTDVQLYLAGNFTCSAENNPIVRQTHCLHVLIPPTVEVSPHFQWSTVGGTASIDCQYESLDDELEVSWYKNNQIIEPNERTSLALNRTRLIMSQLIRSDTGAYACRVTNKGDAALSQDVTSLLVQDDPVKPSAKVLYKQKLWIFHKNGVTIFAEGCGGLLREIDALDNVPSNGLPLCGNQVVEEDPDAPVKCSWSDNAVISDSKLFIGQPDQNRVVIFHTQQLQILQTIATDPRPSRLWLIRGDPEDKIWILCDGRRDSFDRGLSKESQIDPLDSSEEDGRLEEDVDFGWDSSSREQQRHNRKTVQVIRWTQSGRNHDIIHLQPVEGHFDLVYDLFIPQPSTIQMHYSHDKARFAYVTHWDERTLIKIDMEQFKYIKTVNLADCQPIDGVFTDHGLLILQCQTSVTHQLSGQIVLDQLTDSIISYNAHVKAHRSFLSPNHQFLVNIFHNSTTPSPVSTTIIVQKVTPSGLQFLYDVRTTLTIVNCDFVWKNGNYDALLASGTMLREDVLYLSLVDGKIELISGIGRPSRGLQRFMAVSRLSKQAAITSAESVYVIDLNSNMVQCEAQEHRKDPSVLVWT
ncbi:follistatin-related protein 5-like [Brevipalpus obovatus]|uniref:follistatin-related protein 5-like n=1 Tax=Brevipalpus obovatus TaxID=246614 RepID=UPI003D9F0FDE